MVRQGKEMVQKNHFQRTLRGIIFIWEEYSHTVSLAIIDEQEVLQM